jgi:hypothetical protein
MFSVEPFHLEIGKDVFAQLDGTRPAEVETVEPMPREFDVLVESTAPTVSQKLQRSLVVLANVDLDSRTWGSRTSICEKLPWLIADDTDVPLAVDESGGPGLVNLVWLYERFYSHIPSLAGFI